MATTRASALMRADDDARPTRATRGRSRRAEHACEQSTSLGFYALQAGAVKRVARLTKDASGAANAANASARRRNRRKCEGAVTRDGYRSRNEIMD